MRNGALERLWKLQTQVNKLVLEGLRDPCAVSAKLQELLEERRVAEQKFALLVDLGIMTVPDNYNHATALTKFLKKNRKRFYDVNDDITDVNFSNPGRILKPGDKLHVRAFQQAVPGTTTSVERLAFLATQNAVHTGVQGASLVFDQKRDQLPRGKWYVSMDEEEHLWKDPDSDHRVPRLLACDDGDFYFHLADFELAWDDDDVLLCFCDLPDQPSDA